ncbi:dephospho-CoA kinase [bacterium]|nr:dephospho-CoA kinase [bacterium]
MLKVAITGNIASGKTFVETVLSSNGYPVYDTDSIAHTILATSVEVREAFKDYDITNHRGEISREKLGNIVFAKPELKKVLEDIIHPEVRKEINKIFNFSGTADIIFVSVPLLFEAKFDDMFDKSILVYANDDIRLQRLMIRNDLTEEQARLRINSQMPQDEKASKVDYIIHNNTSIKDFEIEIYEVLKSLDNNKDK